VNPPPKPRPALHRRAADAVAKASLFLAYFRWLFMPVGLFALLAVGVHAAADVVDDRLLWLIDRADASFDAFVSQWPLTQPMVNWVGLEQRVWLARALALLWELAADLFLALPALGYEEHASRVPLAQRWKPLWAKVVAHPSGLLVVRPLATLAVSLAGACAVGRMVQGALYLSLRGGLGDGIAGPLARLCAIAALAAVLAAFGGRAFLRNVQHAVSAAPVAGARGRWKRWTAGWLGSLVVAPLALAALVGASPLLSFFR
jgi:hypothetical protein